MLGRSDSTREELDHVKATIGKQLATYKKLAKAIAGETGGTKVPAALREFEGQFFNNMVLVLDRPFVHRVRTLTGKDGNPLNEVELICDSLINNNGVLRGNNVIKYVSDQAVVKIEIGSKIRLSADEFERLCKAFFEELERKCR
jgi:hypothetical protein